MKRERLGTVPVLVALLIDSAGSGLYIPFELLYARTDVGLPLSVAGLVLTLAAGIGLVAGPAAGAAVDRIGAGRIVLVSNLLELAGFGILLIAHSIVPYAASAVLITVGVSAFWSAYAPFMGSVLPATHRDRWFGRLRSAGYAGLALGGLLAGLVLTTGVGGLRVLVAANAVSYVLAGVLIAVQPSIAMERPGAAAARGGYGLALCDRVNLLFAALNVGATMFATIPTLALPIFVVVQLRDPTWAPGILFGVATLVMTVTAALSPDLLRGRRRGHVLQLADGAWFGSFALFAAAVALPRAWLLLLFPASVFLGLGEGLYTPVGDAVPNALAPPQLQGRYTAIHQFAWRITAVVAPVLTTFLLSVSPSALWLTLAAATLVSVTVRGWVVARAGGRDGRMGEGYS